MLLKVLFVFIFATLSAGHESSEDLSRLYVESSCVLQSSSHSNGWKSVAQLSRYYESEDFSCVIKDRESGIKSTGIFEIVATRFPPDEIDFMSDSKSALKLRNSTIVAPYKKHFDFAKEAEDQYPKLSYTYACKEIAGLQILINGAPPVGKARVRKSSRSDPMDNEDFHVNEQATDKPCADSTEKPGRSTQHHHRLGNMCPMENGMEGRLIWVDGSLDCLWCCSGHHWDRRKRQCQLCPPGQFAPKPHPFQYCLSNKNPKSTTEPTTAAAETDGSESTTTGVVTPSTNVESTTTTPQAALTCTKRTVEFISNESEAKSILVAWHASDEERVKDFNIKWYKVESAKEDISPAHSYNIKELEPFTDYFVTVTANYMNGEIVQSDEVIMSTALPPIPNLRNKTIGDTTAKITWSEVPNERDLNVIVRHKFEDSEVKEKRLEATAHEAEFLMEKSGKYSASVFYISKSNITGPPSDLTFTRKPFGLTEILYLLAIPGSFVLFFVFCCACVKRLGWTRRRITTL